jgi:hypothetical protein
MVKKLDWVISEDFGYQQNDYFKELLGQAFKITLSVSMSLGIEKSKLNKSISLPMIAVNKDRYLEAERRYRFSLEDDQLKKEMSKEEFTSLSGLAAMHYSAHLIEALSELKDEVEDIPKNYAGVLAILSSNMERCFVNYICFLKEGKKRELLGHARRELGSRSKGGVSSSSKYDSAREFARSYADAEWSEDPIYPLSKMAGDLLGNLTESNGYLDVGLVKLPSLNTIKNWIKDSKYRTKLSRGAPCKNK